MEWRTETGNAERGTRNDERIHELVHQLHAKLNPPHRQLVPRSQHDAVNLLAVDHRSVGRAEIFDDELVGLVRPEPAVKARDERRVNDEIGASGAADRLDTSGRHAKSNWGFVTALENPAWHD